MRASRRARPSSRPLAGSAPPCGSRSCPIPRWRSSTCSAGSARCRSTTRRSRRSTGSRRCCSAGSRPAPRRRPRPRARRSPPTWCARSASARAPRSPSRGASLPSSWAPMPWTLRYVVGDLSRIDKPPPFQAVLRGIDGNPQLVRWTAIRAQRDAELLSARLKPIPDLTVELGWKHIREPTEEGIRRDKALKLQASIPIPVWDQNLGGITEAGEARAKVEAERAVSKAALILTLGQGLRHARRARRARSRFCAAPPFRMRRRRSTRSKADTARGGSPCSRSSTRKAARDAGGAARAGGVGELPYFRCHHRGPHRHAARLEPRSEADDALFPHRRRPDPGCPAGGGPGALPAAAVRRKGADRRSARPRQARRAWSRRGRRADRREGGGGRHRAGEGRRPACCTTACSSTASCSPTRRRSCR